MNCGYCGAQDIGNDHHCPRGTIGIDRTYILEITGITRP